MNTIRKTKIIRNRMGYTIYFPKDIIHEKRCRKLSYEIASENPNLRQISSPISSSFCWIIIIKNKNQEMRQQKVRERPKITNPGKEEISRNQESIRKI